MAADAHSASRTDTILRVKRKRNEDPIDAFIFELNAQNARRRIEPEGRDIGMFRLAETIPQTLRSNEDRRIIEAEWDSNRHKIAIKRKRDVTSDDGTRKKTAPEQHDKMNHFADMLANYLQRTYQTNSVDSKETKKEKEGEYVYDIYYRQAMPAHWQLPKFAPPRVGPPQIGRASTKAKSYSPVPVGRSQNSTTSAPGFEHLSKYQVSSQPIEDDWEEEDLIPVFFRSTVDEDGRTTVVPISSTGQRLAETLLVEEELTAPPSMLGEDEDSNDEDFYGNDYPDRDEWDESSEASF